jgi:hypothetical protein
MTAYGFLFFDLTGSEIFIYIYIYFELASMKTLTNSADFPESRWCQNKRVSESR